MLFYADEGSGSNSFQAAAETRREEIEASPDFDKNKDIVYIAGFSDISDVCDMVKSCVNQNSEKYGKTQEVGIWSHSGSEDGSRGHDIVKKYPVAGDRPRQMTLEGWNSINYNWSENDAKMLVYGCNSGNEDKGFSFARRVSELDNMNDVSVWGQSTYGYPSSSPYYRKTTMSRSMGLYIGPTYYVGSEKGKGYVSMWFLLSSYPNAKQMNVYRNGRKIKSAYQNR